MLDHGKVYVSNKTKKDIEEYFEVSRRYLIATVEAGGVVANLDIVGAINTMKRALQGLEKAALIVTFLSTPEAKRSCNLLETYYTANRLQVFERVSGDIVGHECKASGLPYLLDLIEAPLPSLINMLTVIRSSKPPKGFSGANGYDMRWIAAKIISYRLKC